jgi:hypothetical protein
MTQEQQDKLDELILELESVDYEDLVHLARSAYNRAIEDALEVLKLEMVKEEDFSVIGKGKIQTRAAYFGPWQKEREGNCEFWVEYNKDEIESLKIK